MGLQLSEEIGIKLELKSTLTFSRCLIIGLDTHVDTIAKVADVAGKEFMIEQVFISMDCVKVQPNAYRLKSHLFDVAYFHLYSALAEFFSHYCCLIIAHIVMHCIVLLSSL